MPKINMDGWKQDKARREERKAQGQCPMCGMPKREQDSFCSDACQQSDARGEPSK